MSTTPTLLLLLTAGLTSGAQFTGHNSKQKVPEVNQHCLNCICQASSNCDETIKCYKAGGYFCGPYIISWAYWYDGGRPGSTGKPHDFEACLTNRKCSEEAVRGYMRRYGRDCDASGYVDCFDFARIHKLGFGQCSREDIMYTEYWKKFEKCYGIDDRPNDRSAPEDDDYYYNNYYYDDNY